MEMHFVKLDINTINSVIEKRQLASSIYREKDTYNWNIEIFETVYFSL